MSSSYYRLMNFITGFMPFPRTPCQYLFSMGVLKTFESMSFTWIFCWSGVSGSKGLNLLSGMAGILNGSPKDEIISVTSGDNCSRFII